VTPDEARDLFSEAFEGELDAERKTELEAMLAADAALRAEYEQFSEILRETHALSLAPPEPAPDLLVGVQRKLRKRSRGRFYRDRFSEKMGAGAVLPVLLGVAMLVILAVAWLTLQYSVVEDPGRPAAPHDSAGP